MIRSGGWAVCGAAVIVASVAAGLAAAAEPAGSSAGSWITFLSHRTGMNLLYRMRPDGSELKPIFGGPIPDAPGLGAGLSLVRAPHWTWQSPDRRHFASCAYEVIRPRDRDGRFQYHFSLHLGRADGTGPTRVIAPVCEEAVAWSPDGKRVAYTVVISLEPDDRNAPCVSRLFVTAIDGTDERLVLERPGHWTPADWSPDGKKLLLLWSDIFNLSLMHSTLLELDMPQVERAARTARPESRWQRSPHGALHEVLGKAAPVEANAARYSPDGKSIAVTAIRKRDKPGEWQSLDFELGVIDRATAAFKGGGVQESGLAPGGAAGPDLLVAGRLRDSVLPAAAGGRRTGRSNRGRRSLTPGVGPRPLVHQAGRHG